MQDKWSPRCHSNFNKQIYNLDLIPALSSGSQFPYLLKVDLN